MSAIIPAPARIDAETGSVTQVSLIVPAATSVDPFLASQRDGAGSVQEMAHAIIRRSTRTIDLRIEERVYISDRSHCE